MELLFKRFIVTGSCTLFVVNCSQASVQLTSSTVRFKVDADCGSLESHDSKANEVKSIK